MYTYAREELEYVKFNPGSRQEIAGHRHVMRLCEHHKHAALVNEAWRSSVVQEGSLLVLLDTGAHHFVVRTLDYMVWLWPASKVGDKCWRPNLEINARGALVVTSFANQQVHPVVVMCPKHLALLDTGVILE